MIDRLLRTLDLAGSCWKVLMLDKEMLLFPIMSLISLFMVAIGVFYPVWAFGHFETLIEIFAPEQQPHKNPLVWALTFACYFVSYFIMIFFNAALITCALIRFAGGNPTVMDGLKASTSRLPQILSWSLVSATIGMILSSLERQSNGIGRFFIKLLGAAWAVMTFFVVPVLVVERVGPFQAMKESVSAVKKTWGESLLGTAGLGLLNIIGMLIAAPIFFAGMMRIQDSPTFGLFCIILAVVCVLLFALVTTTLNAILRAGLYIYAVEGSVPVHFDSKIVENVFQKT